MLSFILILLLFISAFLGIIWIVYPNDLVGTIFISSALICLLLMVVSSSKETKFCPSCGEYYSDAEYCKDCGEKLLIKKYE